MSTTQSPDQWLIRTAENVITGPFSRSHIRELIEQGKLQLNDEVCHANSYWFYLHEHDEIRKQLGIELPKELYAGAEESTQTETDTEITDPGVEPEGTRIAAMGQMRGAQSRVGQKPTARPKEDKIPELSHSIEELGENTAVMSNRAFRDFRQKKKPETASTSTEPQQSAPQVQPTPVVRGISVEKSKLVQLFTFLMMIAALALLAFVIKLLREQSG